MIAKGKIIKVSKGRRGYSSEGWTEATMAKAILEMMGDYRYDKINNYPIKAKVTVTVEFLPISNKKNPALPEINSFKMEKITINAEEICEFPSFQSWVNHASSWLGGIRDRSDVLLCLDKEDNCCNNGADFMKARDNDRFPVKAFILTRSKDT